MKAYARAADAAGYYIDQHVSALRSAHGQGEWTDGLEMEKDKIGDIKELGVTEYYAVKHPVLLSVAVVAMMIN